MKRRRYKYWIKTQSLIQMSVFLKNNEKHFREVPHLQCIAFYILLVNLFDWLQYINEKIKIITNIK